MRLGDDPAALPLPQGAAIASARCGWRVETLELGTATPAALKEFLDRLRPVAVKRNARSQETFVKALEYFRDRHVDAVLVAGDLTNAGLVPEIELVAEAWKKVFPDNKLPDRTVWQGAFTCINTGAMQNQAPGRGRENGTLLSWIPGDATSDPQMPWIDIGQCHAGLVLSLYGTDAVLERRDMVRGEPLGPDLRFSIASEDVKKGVFSDAARSAKAVPPEFGADAKVVVEERRGKTRKGRECDQFVVTFPTVTSKEGRPRAYEYRVSAHASDGITLAYTKVYSPFINCAESHEPATSACVMEKTALLAERCVSFTVEPLDCWGNAGRAVRSRQGARGEKFLNSSCIRT